MARKPADPHKARALERFLEQEGKIKDRLDEAQAGQAKPEGESIYATAIKSATPDQVTRAQHITGMIDSSFYEKKYKLTGNPLWLWLTLSDLKSPQDIPPETFAYLRKVGRALFQEIVAQLQALDRVRIEPGAELHEGITRPPRQAPPSQRLADILEVSMAGANPFQDVARDLQGLSMAVAVAELVERTGCTQEDAYAALAVATGRSSTDSGPSAETIRKIARRGKALLPRRTTSDRKDRSVGKTDA